MGMFDFLSPGGDPSKEANKYLEQIPGRMEEYLNPYMKQGGNALNQLMQQYGDLLASPGSIYEKFSQGYHPSEGYGFQLGEGQRAMNQTASAGGMLGSPQEQAEMAKYSQALASNDFDNYMKNILGMYGQGMQGMGNIGQMGYGASGTMAEGLKDMLSSQASGAYSNAASKRSGFSKLIGSGLGGALGFATGGPVGAIGGAAKGAGWF